MYAFDKLKLASLCLKSFVRSFKETKPKIHFLLDSCPPEWEEMIDSLVYWDHEIEHLRCNDQNQSYLIQLDRAKPLDEPVLFQEDDYVYLDGAGRKIEEALKELEFINPYDHKEFYDEKLDYHRQPSEIKLVGDQHWRTIDFNTMTWGCHSGRLTNYWETLHIHGFWDKDTWDDMAKEGAKLWSPIPTLCTHLHQDFLSPGVDWNKRFNELEN
jgi:hypothetical protein